MRAFAIVQQPSGFLSVYLSVNQSDMYECLYVCIANSRSGKDETFLRSYQRKCARTHAHKRTLALARAHTYKKIHPILLVFEKNLLSVQTHTYTYIHTYIHKHIHTYTNTYIYIHTYIHNAILNVFVFLVCHCFLVCFVEKVCDEIIMIAVHVFISTHTHTDRRPRPISPSHHYMYN